jgi:adenylosuccinate synthase
MGVKVVVGAQWGDEGKGKIVDILSHEADVVVRYGGGANAGHTLVIGGKKTVIRLVPSGVMHPHTTCVLGPGMVIDPEVLLAELETLSGLGALPQRERVLVSERAHVVLPHHVRLDEVREAGAAAIGTTKRGIGPAYEDKVARTGVRMCDLASPERLREQLQRSLARWKPTFDALGIAAPEPEELARRCEAVGAKLAPMIVDTSEVLDEALRSGKRIVLEGAQGTMLDIDHGTYPHVTSSTVLAGGAASGGGIAPNRITDVVGITKAYATRVGGGPFPTELLDELGDRIRTAGGEFGSVTGRPRRCGWLDIPVLRQAVRMNGVTELAITKLDVLRGIHPLRIAVAYEVDGRRVVTPPALGLERAVPVFEEHPGWDADLRGARTLADLPATVRRFVDRVAELSGARIGMISVGPDRDETIRP